LYNLWWQEWAFTSIPRVANFIFHPSAAKPGKANVPDLDVDFEGNEIVHTRVNSSLLS
jgi:hypothetical protein